MRNLAGVLLIVAALVNGVAGGLYLAGGGLSAAVGTAAESAARDNAHGADTAAGPTVSQAQRAQSDGKALMGFGAFLLAMLVVQIAAGVCLFVKKGTAFVAAAGGLGLVAESVGMYLTHHVGVTNMLGLLASLLGIAAALSLRRQSARAQSAAPALAMAAR